MPAVGTQTWTQHWCPHSPGQAVEPTAGPRHLHYKTLPLTTLIPAEPSLSPSTAAPRHVPNHLPALSCRVAPGPNRSPSSPALRQGLHPCCPAKFLLLQQLIPAQDIPRELCLPIHSKIPPRCFPQHRAHPAVALRFNHQFTFFTSPRLWDGRGTSPCSSVLVRAAGLLCFQLSAFN